MARGSSYSVVFLRPVVFGPPFLLDRTAFPDETCLEPTRSPRANRGHGQRIQGEPARGPRGRRRWHGRCSTGRTHGSTHDDREFQVPWAATAVHGRTTRRYGMLKRRALFATAVNALVALALPIGLAWAEQDRKSVG